MDASIQSKSENSYSATRETKVLVDRHSNQRVIENLVLVSVDDDILGVVVQRCKKTVHPRWVLEAVMQHCWGVADFAHVIECIAVELLDHVTVELSKKGFVEELYSNNDILHISGGVLVLNNLQRGMSVSERIFVAPSGVCGFPATVIEPVLGFGSTMQVNNDFEASLSRPIDSRI
jgi:hypothetical protein